MFKMDDGHSGNDKRVAALSKSYLTTTGITMLSFGQTNPNFRKASL